MGAPWLSTCADERAYFQTGGDLGGDQPLVNAVVVFLAASLGAGVALALRVVATIAELAVIALLRASAPGQAAASYTVRAASAATRARPAPVEQPVLARGAR